MVVARKVQDHHVPPEVARKARVTATGIRKLRGKLGLSQQELGKLIGVTAQSILSMEHKDGKLNVRSATLSKILAVREMGKREAKRRLEEIVGEK